MQQPFNQVPEESLSPAVITSVTIRPSLDKAFPEFAMDDESECNSSFHDDALHAEFPLFGLEEVRKARMLQVKAWSRDQHRSGQNGLPNGRISSIEFQPQGTDVSANAKVELLEKEIQALKEKVSSLSASELSNQNQVLRQENQRLQSQINKSTKRMTLAVAAEAMANEVENSIPVTNNHTAAIPSDSEGRLRAVLTRQGTTTGELRQAINAVESLVDEARRELDHASLRERRAAFEALHAAISLGEEDVLEEAIEKARLTDVEVEDVSKGEAKLAELRALTPEQKAAKLANKLESAAKKEAFVLIKRDDCDGLQNLIAGLDDKVRIQNWRDYAGRSLWKCSLELRAERVQAYLAPLFGQRLPEDVKKDSKRPSMMQRPSIAVDELGDGKRPSIGSPAGGRHGGSFSSESGHRRSLFSGGSGPERKLSGDNLGRQDSRGSPSGSPKHTPTIPGKVPSSPSSGSAGKAEEVPKDASPLPPPALPVGLSTLEEADGNQASPSGNSGPAEGSADAISPTRSSPERSDAENAQLRAQAFRAVAQDDADSLEEVLAAIHRDVWTLWQNKAGKDLLTLSQERGSSMAYSMLARELGMLKENEAHRESFEERESVWIFLAGEVQPRRATVLEDTSVDEEEVLIEFWDGDDESIRVDRCLIHKMYS